MTKLNPRPVYNNPKKPVVNNNVNKFPRLTNQEWDDIIGLIDDKLERQYYECYQTIKDKLESYRQEDVIVNRLCDTNISDYDSIQNRY